MNIIEQKEGVYTHFATTSLEKPRGYLLIELPHGSTTTNDFKWYQKRLQGDYPPNIIDFFYVNTDVGSPEIAFEIAQQLKDNYEIHILRSHIPRTFIDCNRVVGEGISYSKVVSQCYTFLCDQQIGYRVSICILSCLSKLCQRSVCKNLW